MNFLENPNNQVVGYIRTNSTRDGFVFKVPAKTDIIQLEGSSNGKINKIVVSTDGVVSVNSTANSTDTLSGAFITAGGVGIGKDLYVGGNIHADTIRSETVYITDTTDAISSTTGSMIVSGGVGIAKDLYVGGTIHGDLGPIISTNPIIITNTTGSMSTSTGSFITLGGVGIAKNTVVGGTVVSNGVSTTTMTINNLHILDTTDSISTTTGSLVLAGGLGIAKSLNVGGSLVYQSIRVSSTTESVNTETGALIVEGGVAIKKNLNVGGSLVVNGAFTFNSLNTTGTITTTNTTNATTTTTGSIITSGGIAIAKDVYIGGYVYGNFTFLKIVPSSMTITNSGTNYNIPFASTVVGSGFTVDTSGDPDVFTVPITGVYLLTIKINYSNRSTTIDYNTTVRIFDTISGEVVPITITIPFRGTSNVGWYTGISTVVSLTAGRIFYFTVSADVGSMTINGSEAEITLLCMGGV